MILSVLAVFWKPSSPCDKEIANQTIKKTIKKANKNETPYND